MLRKLWRRLVAHYRFDLRAVCELSSGRGLYDDYHDYPDGTDDDLGAVHDYVYTCRRCQKNFMI